MDRFDWLVTECAPAGFPARIVGGDLFFEDGSSLYIPARRVVNNGWGATGSIHIAGDDLKPAPVRLEVTWLSYTEDRFYRGAFDLPASLLLALFRSGLPSPRDGRHITYDRVVVGVAPGGAVSVWMGAQRVVTEVAVFRASEADVPWEGVLGDPDMSRAAHVAAILEETRTLRSRHLLAEAPELLERWSLYPCRARWSARPEPGSPVRAIWIHGFNGEVEWVDVASRDRDSSPGLATRAVPRVLIPHWTHSTGLQMTTEIRLDEVETFAAFAALSEEARGLPLVLLAGTHGAALAVDSGPAEPVRVHRMKYAQVDVYGHP